MLHPYVYFVAACALALLGLLALPLARTRKAMVRALPAGAFFALLLGVAEAAFALGQRQAGAGTGAEGVLHTCSMHPQIRLPEQGLCPICRMELVPIGSIDAIGGSAHEVTIDPVVVQNMGVRVGPARRGPMQRSLRAYAEFAVDESRIVDLTLKFDAFVEELFAHTEGMTIAAGAPLFSVYSPDLLVAQTELIAARQGGDPELLAAARTKLLLWDLPPAQIAELEARSAPQRAIPWRSPHGGVLLRRSIVAGSPAAKNTPLLRIADLSSLWLDAKAPASMLPALAAGQLAAVQTPDLPGRELTGRIAMVLPSIDAKTRTGTVRLQVDNAEGRLLPGMHARVRFLHKIADDAVFVPLEATLATGTRDLVWTAVGKGRFAPQDVVLGEVDDDGNVQVLSGLQAGELVVLSGQFLIDSESRLREGSRKFGEEGLMPGGDLPPPQPEPLSAPTQAAVDALAMAYVTVCEEFAADRFQVTTQQTLRDAASELVRIAAEPVVQLPATELANLLAQPSLDLEAARVRFKQASQLAAALFAVARPLAAAERQTLFVHHCPMAEADWLQFDDQTRNPYYGSSMLECGEVRRSLPLQQGEGR